MDDDFEIFIPPKKRNNNIYLKVIDNNEKNEKKIINVNNSSRINNNTSKNNNINLSTTSNANSNSIVISDNLSNFNINNKSKSNCSFALSSTSSNILSHVINKESIIDNSNIINLDEISQHNMITSNSNTIKLNDKEDVIVLDDEPIKSNNKILKDNNSFIDLDNDDDIFNKGFSNNIKSNDNNIDLDIDFDINTNYELNSENENEEEDLLDYFANLEDDDDIINCVCGLDMSDMNSDLRSVHVGHCLLSFKSKSILMLSPTSKNASKMRDATYFCPKCSRDLSNNNFINRVTHLKKCKPETEITSAIIEVPTNTKRVLPDYFITTYKPQIPDKKKTLFDFYPGLGLKSTTAINNSTTESKNKKKDFSNSKSSAPCPFYKKIEGTTIIVDGFKFSNTANSTFFILSHWHSDHYQGITSGWNYGKIYTSVITARLLVANYPKLEPLVVSIPLNNRVQFHDDNGTMFYLTLIDANHCPGAVCIIIEVRNRKILHVGDMRFDSCMSSWDGWKDLKLIDLCYLDTTYCHPKHVFPPQWEMIEYAANVIQEALRTNALVIVGTYYIGKEKILIEVARRCNIKIYAAPYRFKVLNMLEMGDLWTDNINESPVRIVPMNEISFKCMSNILSTALQIKKYSNIVGIRPTGWTGTPGCNAKGNMVLHSIPYSEHSSFNELLNFIDFVKPKRVNPTVGNSTAAQVNEMKRYLKIIN